MSYPTPNVSFVSERWSTDDVLALAPDSSSGKSAAKLAKTANWPVTGYRTEPGAAAPVVFGECAGSGSKAYQVSVDLSAAGAPGYRCSCPSRKFPCKHVLGLLLLWARGEDSGESDGPEWVAEWVAKRREKAAAKTTPGANAAPADPAAAARRVQRREELVAEGLAELELWLTDQVTAGLAALPRAKYAHWDSMAARLVDCQAGRVAARVRALSGVTASADWPARVVTEFALLRLLCAGYQRREQLSPPLLAALRAQIGFTGSDEPAPAPREVWTVLGRHDFEVDELRGRRFWLRGRESGRTAQMLSFAPRGGTPESPVRAATAVDAELQFQTGLWRASIVAKHGEHPAEPPVGGSVSDALRSYADALAEDPWLETWPVVLSGAVLARDGSAWWAADPTGDALPLLPESGPPWQFAAFTGGAPATVAAELSPDGLRPLTVWDADGSAVSL